MVTGGGCRPGHRRVHPLWVDLKLSLYCCGYAPATRDCVTSQLHSSHPRLRIPDMTRPLPIAASLVLAALSFAAFAQTETETAPPATSESPPVPVAPAPVAPTGSAERGKQPTFPRQGCHGVVGYKNASPHYPAPLTGGHPATDLVNAPK